MIEIKANSFGHLIQINPTPIKPFSNKMYGYTPQQAAYAQYTHNQQATTYSSNPVNYTTQQPQQHGAANGAATAPAQLQSVGTPATQYSLVSIPL